jgi:hypothetical protein
MGHVSPFRTNVAWYAVYSLVPGAKAICAVGRYQIFLAAPVIGLAIAHLAERAKKVMAPVLIVGCVLLIVEESNLPVLALNRPREISRLGEISAPPAGCEAFFVSEARPEKYVGYLGPAIDGIYSHNVDAMLIAETKMLPTINGFSTFVPPGWDLTDPDNSSYSERVLKYAALHGVRKLCALNLRTMSWTAAH